MRTVGPIPTLAPLALPLKGGEKPRPSLCITPVSQCKPVRANMHRCTRACYRFATQRATRPHRSTNNRTQGQQTMASILRTENGRWRAQVRRAGAKSRAKTFSKREDACRWARQLEGRVAVSVQQRGSIDADKVTVARILKQYRELREEGNREVVDQSNESYMLQHLEDDLGEYRVVAL